MVNAIYGDVRSERRVATVPTNTAPGVPLIIGGQPVVTITGSGDYKRTTEIVAGNTKTTIEDSNAGGVGLGPLQATVSPTGSYSFPVTGATAATAVGTAVYLTAGGALTLTSGGGNVKFGAVDFFRGETSATDTIVKIGVNLG